MCIRDRSYPVRYELFHDQCRQKTIQIALCDVDTIFFPVDLRRPLKPSSFPAFVVQDESVFVPLQHFDLVPLSVAEDEQCPTVGIQLETALDDGGKSVDGFAHIRKIGTQIHRLTPVKTPDHDALSTTIICAICSGAAVRGRRTVMVPQVTEISAAGNGI